MELTPESFCERQDIGLGGGVDREIWNGKNAGEGADVQNGTASGDESREKSVGEVGECLHVEADHLFRLIPVGSMKLAVVSHAGIVQQEIGIEVLLRERIKEVVATGIVCEVGGEGFHP